MKKLLFNYERNIIEILKQCRDENEAQLVLRGKNIYLTTKEIKNIKEQFNKTFNENQILTHEQLANIAGGGVHAHLIETSKLTPDQLSTYNKQGNNQTFRILNKTYAILGFECKENNAAEEEYAGMYLHLHDKHEKIDAEHQGKMSYSSEEKGFIHDEGSLDRALHNSIVHAIYENIDKTAGLKLADTIIQSLTKKEENEKISIRNAFRNAFTGHKPEGKQPIAEPADAKDKAIYEVLQSRKELIDNSTHTRRRVAPQTHIKMPPKETTTPHPTVVHTTSDAAAAAHDSTFGASVGTHSQPAARCLDTKTYVERLAVPPWVLEVVPHFKSWDEIFEICGTKTPVSGQPLTIRQATAHSVFSSLCENTEGMLDRSHPNFPKAYYIAVTVCHDDAFMNYLSAIPQVGISTLYKSIIERMRSYDFPSIPETKNAALSDPPPAAAASVAAQETVSQTGSAIPSLTEAQKNENSLRLFYGITD